MAIICDNYSPHLTTRRDARVGTWAKANNVEIAYTPTNSSWLNRIEAQFTALRYFTLDGTDHPACVFAPPDQEIRRRASAGATVSLVRAFEPNGHTGGRAH